MDSFEKIVQDPASRRTFLATMGAAGLGLAALSLFDPPGGRLTRSASGAAVDNTGPKYFPTIPGRNINEIVVNFALTLEILEADLYRQALNQATGRTLQVALDGDPTQYKLAVSGGGLSAPLTQAGFQYLVDFAYVEAAHRDFLAMLLVSLGAPVVKANPNGYAFPGGPGGDLKAILSNILPLEETGVRAYLGALPYFTDLKTFATTAATIYSTEARHSAAISYTIGVDPGPNPLPGDMKVTPKYPAPNTFEYYQTPVAVLTAAKKYFR